MGYYGHHIGHFGGMGFGLAGFFMIIFWVAIVFAVIAFFRGASGHSHWHGIADQKDKGSKALDILKERYAKGEITKENFEKMKKDLE